MASDAEVREWARGEGIEVPTRGKLNPRFHGLYGDAHPEMLSVDQDDDVDQVEGDSGETAPSRPAEMDTGETAPRPPAKPSLGGRLRKKLAGAGGRARRVSLEQVCASGWSMLAAVAAQGGLTPTSRVLSMQAPVAGVILEDTLKGTLADKVLQPLARSAQKGSQVGALLGPPVLVSLLHTQPHLSPQLLPILRMTLRQWMLVAGPALKAQQKKEARALEALGLEEGDDLNAMIEAMIVSIFTPAEPQGAAVPDAG